jgi:CRP-like cAMP-binding protein
MLSVLPRCIVKNSEMVQRRADGAVLQSPKGLDDLAKMELAGVLTPQVVLPSHDLCRAGDPADSLWILQSGCPTPSASGM